MDHLQRLANQLRIRLFLAAMIGQSLVIGLWWLLSSNLEITATLQVVALGSGSVLVAMFVAWYGTRVSTRPTEAIWRTVLQLSPDTPTTAAPSIEKLRVGRELVAGLSAQIYQLANMSSTDAPKAKSGQGKQRATVLAHLPVPVFGLDSKQTIAYANEAASRYLGKPLDDIVGADFYSLCNLAFSGESTLDSWLSDVSGRQATASNSWSRVRLKLDDVTKQFDLAADFSKDNPAGVETTLALFDHSEQYGQDDDGIGFIALCVHELRTPLTLLRGYIEVFQREVDTSSNPELKDFMQKMSAASRQLTAFVSTILNVARADSDQLTLSLQEDNWEEVLTSAVSTLQLLADVRGVKLECTVDPHLPTVGVDRVSIYEVIYNLVDNALKYSGDSKKIAIHSGFSKDGLVETTVQDWGVGIPSSTMPNLFTKFYRNFRNRAQIGGTGLGLYLCKAIVAAHGGNIWVRSHEGEGATFGFTVLPYAQLADSQKNGDNKEIIRGAHGWIKNHSLYRR